jgi:2-phospho-L-lactate guanylyltransferase
MQATVFDFDERDGSGTLVLDNGERLAFGPAAFAASGLRLLRPGQRVRLTMSSEGDVDWLTIVTLPART